MVGRIENVLKTVLMIILIFSKTAWADFAGDLFLIEEGGAFSSLQDSSTLDRPVFKKEMPLTSVKTSSALLKTEREPTALENVSPVSVQDNHQGISKSNRISISGALGVSSLNSSSDLAYYNFNYVAPSFGLVLEFKLNTDWSLLTRGDYLPNAYISDKELSGERTSFQKEKNSLGIQRSLDGLQMPVSVEVGSIWESFRIPKSAGLRVGYYQVRPYVLATAKIAHLNDYKSIFKISYQQTSQMVESKTLGNLSSGKDYHETTLMVSIGGELKSSRRNAIFWEASVDSKNGAFSGTANQPDFISNKIIKNGSIQSENLSISLGYQWGS